MGQIDLGGYTGIVVPLVALVAKILDEWIQPTKDDEQKPDT